MKRQLYFLLMALLIPFFGCGNATSTNASNNSTQPDVQYNMAIMDKGHVILYDLTNRIAAPIEAETDSVFNMVFGSDRVYYSVKQGNKTILKYVVLNDPDLKPQLAADWEVPYDCCVGTAYYCLEAPALQYVPEQNILAMNYMMEPNYGYSEYRIFDPATGKSVNAMDWEGDLTFLNYDMFDPFEGQFACAEDNGDLYYRQGDDMIFLSDRLEFEVDSDTPDELPFFEVLSMDPTGKYVLFKAATTFGEDDDYHGPQCYASLDGKVQKVLGTYDEKYPGQWLPDGSLVYGSEGIHLLAPSGKDIVLCPGRSFVLRP